MEVTVPSTRLCFTTGVSVSVLVPGRDVAIQRLHNHNGKVCKPMQSGRADDLTQTVWKACSQSRAKFEVGKEWRPHSINGKDIQDQIPDEIPVELADGFVEDEGAKARFDLDADEAIMLLKMRRSLHEDDYKKIFNEPGVGGI